MDMGGMEKNPISCSHSFIAHVKNKLKFPSKICNNQCNPWLTNF